MNIFASLSLISSVILFALGIFVYFRNPKSPLHRVFLLLALTMAWWAFTEFMLRYTTAYPDAYFWMRLTAFWTFVPVLSLNFTWILTQPPERQKKVWIYPFMYLPAVLFCILELATDLINVQPVMKYWGYSYGIAEDPVIYTIELAWAFGLMMLALVICLDYYLKSHDTRKKKQAKYIMIGLCIPLLSAVVSIVVLPVFGIVVPEMITIFVLFFSGFVGYATWKYELFVLTPATAADTILSTMNDLLVLLDAEKNIVAVNRATCETLGYQKEELSGSSIRVLIDDRPDRAGFLADLTGGGGPLSDAEMVCRKKDGTFIPVSIAGSVIRDNAGSISGIVIVLRDITRRKLEEDERKMVLEKLNLLSGITRHDLLNQLTALESYLDLVMTLEKDPGIVAYLSKMQNITDVIDEQISFARDFEEIGTRAPVWHDVAAGIRRSIASLPVHDIRTVIDLQGIEVFADPLFERVFYNLIDNALRHGGEKLTTIRFSFARSDGGIVLVCEDDGSGISAEDRTGLFKKGFGKHTGLGLFLIRGILGITGITISETGTIGSGARFELAVPEGAFRFTERTA